MKDRHEKNLKIGLTGGIGSGKSQVLQFIAARGVPVLQTDQVGHQLLNERPFLNSLVKAFDDTILGIDGKIDRKKLSKEVFKYPQKRKKLNDLLHPEIRKRVSDWIERQARKNLPFHLVVVEVPLLFERGYYKFFDGVLCVSSSIALRRRRLMKRGWDLSEIRKREETQWPQTRKNKMADWVIFNQSGRKELKYAVDQWLKQFKK